MTPSLDELSSTSPTSMAPKTGFFDLPAEIRNIIYCLALSKNGLIKPKLDVEHFEDTKKPGSILRVSKTFGVEAAPFIYGTCHFTFLTLFDAMLFIRLIGKHNDIHLIGLHVGTFWYRYRQSSNLGWKYDHDLPLSGTFLAQRCPRLEYLQVGDVSAEVEKFDWRIKTLDYLKTLIDALPQLSRVSYGAREKNLRLTAPGNAIACRRTAFDVDEEIRKWKEATKARRSAAGKKANRVKRAKTAAKS